MTYVSERVINISELEKIINRALLNAQLLNKEIKNNSSSNGKIEELSNLVVKELKRISNFEFCVERRKTITENNQSIYTVSILNNRQNPISTSNTFNSLW